MKSPTNRLKYAIACAASAIVFFMGARWISRSSETPSLTGRLPDTMSFVASGPEVERVRGELHDMISEAQRLAEEPPAPSLEDAESLTPRSGSTPLPTPTDFDLRDRFQNGPSFTIKAHELMYHIQLNPSTRAMTDSEASELQSIVHRWSRMIGSAHRDVTLGREHEFRELVDAGMMRPLAYTDDPVMTESMNAIRAGARASGDMEEPLFTAPVYYKDAKGLEHFLRRHGTNFGATDADLPRFEQNTKGIQELSLLYFDTVAAWFVGRLFLDSADAMKLRSYVRG